MSYTDEELRAMQSTVLETKDAAPRKWKQSDISQCCGGGNSHLSGVINRKAIKTPHNETVMFNVQVLGDTFRSDRLKAESDRTLPTDTSWEEARRILLPKFRVLKKKKKPAPSVDDARRFVDTLDKLLATMEQQVAEQQCTNNILRTIASLLGKDDERVPPPPEVPDNIMRVVKKHLE